ncbi:hypothetical protein FRC08_003590 [Ceratobasidium sp. 394]|nr:hypothetical protein FRC08_003590 [Ceratobasidium sp. 394]KAG9088420.1 hypothetical protein FS749_002175 [Ceratobasidium sp. UAMH 11750]
MRLLEYPISHPYPRERVFTVITVVLIVLVLPILVVVNLIATGYELAPTLRPDFNANDTVPQWMRSSHLPPFLRRAIPPCQPKDLGRGDMIHLTPSLFEYKILSTWRDSESLSPVPEDETRIEYRGGSFSNCVIYETGFDYSWIDGTQTVTVGINCFAPVNLLMETTVTFANDFTKDAIGNYYGYNINLLKTVRATSRNYRRVALAVLDAISTDSLAIFGNQFLLSPVSSLSTHLNRTSGFHDTFIRFMDGSSSYTEMSLGPAAIYHDTIQNLAIATINAVQLDLNNAELDNFLLNPSAMNKSLVPNLAPKSIKPDAWVSAPQSWYYGGIVPPYQTWAQMLLAGHPKNITLGDLTGLPPDSKVLTNYLCPSYQLKPISSLLASVFVGTAAMCISAWAMWKFVTALIAQQIEEPCFHCTCDKHSDSERGTIHHCGRGIVATGLAADFVLPPLGPHTRHSTSSDFDKETSSEHSAESAAQKTPTHTLTL